MLSYTFSSFAEILHIEPAQQVSDPVIEYLLTDSRKLLLPSETIFFSIGSGFYNANRFISTLYEKGVRCFIINPELKQLIDRFPEGNFVIAGNVLEALQIIATYHRMQFNYPVIGITGSNGKTIVKEWLNQLLYNTYHIVRSPKSYNSQLGVPLSVWQMNDSYQLGIFEAGISECGEMEKLEKIIQPGIGIFTYTGDAHASGFKSIEEKVSEKLQLFINATTLVYCADDTVLQEQVVHFKDSRNKNLRLFGWSYTAGHAVHISVSGTHSDGTTIQCVYLDAAFDFTIPFTDHASIHNAITCVCTLLLLNVPVDQIISSAKELRTIEMRLELKQGINNCSIINDSYSSDLDSLMIALDFLSQQKQHPVQTVILSDMLQTGKSPAMLYGRIAGVLKQKNISRLIGIGPAINSHSGLFHSIKEAQFYTSTDSFIAALPGIRFHDETILLKGARLFGFERISHVFEEKKHETVLEINLNALNHNLNFYRKQLLPGVKVMVMVKALSYGSGSFEIANVMQHAGVDYLAVAYTDEGLALRQAGIQLPIMVLNIEEAGFDNLVRFDLEPELYSFSIANAFINYLRKNEQSGYPVHIKLDTGMHRLGFEKDDIEKLCLLLQSSPEVQVRSIFSHLAASHDAAHDEFSNHQATEFESMASNIQDKIGYKAILHLANTSAIHRHKAFQYNMVRLGIGLYGIDSESSIQDKLQYVTTLRTSISQIKKVKRGESVGYSRQATVDAETTIATVRVGYADGYPRSLGNGIGKMLVNGKLAPVIGNVCMDMSMLDITGIDVSEGDKVIVFGNHPTVDQLAKWAQTISYEILTSISQRVKRVYFEE